MYIQLESSNSPRPFEVTFSSKLPRIGTRLYSNYMVAYRDHRNVYVEHANVYVYIVYVALNLMRVLTKLSLTGLSCIAD